MALPLFIAGCLMALRITGADDPATTNEQEFSAWQAINAVDQYHLMYRSYEYEERLGGNAKCVSVKLCEKNENNQTARFRVTYRDAATATLKGFTALTSVARSPGSDASDIMRIGSADVCDAGPGAQSAEYKVLYSNYETCVVVKRFGICQTRCEMWVKEGYKFECENGTKQYIHDKDVKKEEEEDSEDSEEGEPQRAGGLGKCIEVYAQHCGCPRFYVYDKEICSSSSKVAETVETTSATTVTRAA